MTLQLRNSLAESFSRQIGLRSTFSIVFLSRDKIFAQLWIMPKNALLRTPFGNRDLVFSLFLHGRTQLLSLLGDFTNS